MLAEMCRDCVAASTRESDVEYDGVKSMRQGKRKADISVGRNCYLEAGLGKPSSQ